MSTSTSGGGAPHTTSWAAATWVAPVVPAFWTLAVILLTNSPRLSGETITYVSGVVLALSIALVGAGLCFVPKPHVRGVGVGLPAGGLVCALSSVWALAQ